MTKQHKGKEKRYCSYCGCLMARSFRIADENMMFYGDYPTMPYGSRFNKKTGKLQFCPYYICPKHQEKKWYEASSPHDEYFLEELWSYNKLGVIKKINE